MPRLREASPEEKTFLIEAAFRRFEDKIHDAMARAEKRIGAQATETQEYCLDQVRHLRRSVTRYLDMNNGGLPPSIIVPRIKDENPEWAKDMKQQTRNNRPSRALMASPGESGTSLDQVTTGRRDSKRQSTSQLKSPPSKKATKTPAVTPQSNALQQKNPFRCLTSSAEDAEGSDYGSNGGGEWVEEEDVEEESGKEDHQDVGQEDNQGVGEQSEKEDGDIYEEGYFYDSDESSGVCYTPPTPTPRRGFSGRPNASKTRPGKLVSKLLS